MGLDPPAPRLRRLLAAEGFPYPEAVVQAALGEEMRHYRAHKEEARDAPTLAALRASCASVLGRELPDGHPLLPRLTEILVASLEFVLLPDARPALDELVSGGYRLAVVSNWDYELPSELARLGILDRFEVVAVSAALGVAKPDPAIFAWALDALGVTAGEAVHCGDRPDKDCAGARAAGIRAVLLDREALHEGAPCARISALTDLPALLDGRSLG